MPQIIPFKAVRPTRDKAHLVASRSYVTYSPRHLNRKLSENPYSFIHIINPEHGVKNKSRPNSRTRFTKIKKRFIEFFEAGVLQQDETPALYIYRQTNNDRQFTGIVCGVEIKAYLDGKIKIHEQTLTSRVEVFTKYLDICDFNAEPVLLTYKGGKAVIEKTVAKYLTKREEFDFSTTDGVRHQLWPILDTSDIQSISETFSAMNCLYIADGHHRMASSANLGTLRMRKKGWQNDDISNFALAYIIPDKELFIRPFHRVLELQELIKEKVLLEQLQAKFDIRASAEAVFPNRSNQFGMRLPSGWYLLKLRQDPQPHSVVDGLDPMILTKTILEPIFGIRDQKTDKRIAFVPGNLSLEGYERAVEQGAASVIFTLFPVGVEEIISVSDAGEIMPPKSTYVEPKLRSGLTIMKLS